ncbi:hypothetical protein QR680_007886 [Steinernema hermaphroditum]|uniref:Uncharacterized protein n=1 Tax=Steinernema hermaphroditum TaxID=289476 RepID=A0AA39M737_9BILA|nr:hypothetical protein QR680_007886 [Steinernema hermaphroditum]
MILFVFLLLLVTPTSAGVGGNQCIRTVYVTESMFNQLSQEGYRYSLSYMNAGEEDCDDTLFSRNSCVTVTWSDGSTIAGCANKNDYLTLINAEGYCNGGGSSTFDVTCCKPWFGSYCNKDAASTYNIPDLVTCRDAYYLDSEISSVFSHAGYSPEVGSSGTRTCSWPWTQCVTLAAGGNNHMTSCEDDFENLPSCGSTTQKGNVIFEVECCHGDYCNDATAPSNDLNRYSEVSLSQETLNGLGNLGISISNSPLAKKHCPVTDDHCVELLLGPDTIKGCSSDPVLELYSANCGQQSSQCGDLPLQLLSQTPLMCCCANDYCNTWSRRKCYRRVELSPELKQLFGDIPGVNVTETPQRTEECISIDDKCVTLIADDGSAVEGCSNDGPVIQTLASQCPTDNSAVEVSYSGGAIDIPFTLNLLLGFFDEHYDPHDDSSFFYDRFFDEHYDPHDDIGLFDDRFFDDRFFDDTSGSTDLLCVKNLPGDDSAPIQTV